MEADARPQLARWCALLVAVVACGQTRDTIDFDFVEFDDSINILVNPHLGPPSREALAWMFSDLEYMRRYVPLGWLGFSLVYQFSGLAPAGYHVANVVLHVANSMLVLAVLLALVRRFAAEADETWRVGAALLGALWWSLHPLRAETVGWASGLLYGLAGCLALLSVLAYLQAWAPGAARFRYLVGAALLYAASMLAYPMSLGLAGVFILIDLACRTEPSRWSWRRLALEKMLFAVPLVAVLVATAVASYAAPEHWRQPPSWAEFGAVARWQQAGLVWAYYLWKPWWPANLTPVPTWLVDFDGGGARAAISLILLGGTSLLLVVQWRRLRGAALGWFAHVAMLLPLLGIAERPHFASDRYHYLAGVVMAAAVALLVARAAAKIRIPIAVAAVAGVVALGLAQRRQLAIWADSDSLMQRIVGCAEHDGMRTRYQRRWIRVHLHRGNLARAGEIAAQAGIPLAEVVEPTPDGVPIMAALHLRLARNFLRGGRRIEAHEHCRSALQLVPQWSEAAYDWALLLASDGAALEALHWYRRAAAPGLGRPVPLAARQRLLSMIAEVFFVTDRARLAARTIEFALREGGGAGADPELEGNLPAQLACYRAAATR